MGEAGSFLPRSLKVSAPSKMQSLVILSTGIENFGVLFAIPTQMLAKPPVEDLASVNQHISITSLCNYIMPLKLTETNSMQFKFRHNFCFGKVYARSIY